LRVENSPCPVIYYYPMKLDKKKKQTLIIVAAVLAILITAAAGLVLLTRDSSGFKTVTPKEAVKLMETRKDLLILDIRGPEELREGWIEGSQLMPMTEILRGTMAPPKDRPILLVCAVGGRSLALGKAMITYGWPEVYNLKSGIEEWKRQGYPVRYQ